MWPYPPLFFGKPVNMQQKKGSIYFGNFCLQNQCFMGWAKLAFFFSNCNVRTVAQMTDIYAGRPYKCRLICALQEMGQASLHNAQLICLPSTIEH